MQCTSGVRVWTLGFTLTTSQLCPTGTTQRPFSRVRRRHTALRQQLTRRRRVCASLTSCVSEVAKWCASRRLQLNDDKTEMIWFGSRSNMAKLQRINLSLQVGTSITAQQRRPGSGILYGLRADDEKTRRQNCCCLLLPHSSSALGSSSDRPGSHTAAGPGVHNVQAGLL